MLGDRRDHYESEADLWQIMARIVQGRKEREIDPAVAAINHVLKTAEGDPMIGKVAMARLREMQSFTNTLDTWFTQMMAVPPATLMALIKLGSKRGRSWRASAAASRGQKFCALYFSEDRNSGNNS